MLVTGSGAVQPEARKKKKLSSGTIGMTLFLATEVMFFAAIVSAYTILRTRVTEWPPWGQPRLPVMTTAFNSLILIMSGFVLFGAYKRFIIDHVMTETCRKWLGTSILLGSFFVLFQGYEWVELIQFGLTMTSSTYGSLFYMIVGVHALHAVSALAAMIYIYVRSLPNSNRPIVASEFLVTALFWYFVVGVWPILYVMVYLI